MATNRDLFIKQYVKPLILRLIISAVLFHALGFFVIFQIRNGFVENLNVLLASDESFANTSYLSKRLVEFQKLDLLSCFRIQNEANFEIISSSYNGTCSSDYLLLTSLPIKTQFRLTSGKTLFLSAMFLPSTATLSLIYILYAISLLLIYVLARNSIKEKAALTERVQSELSKLEEFKRLSKQIAHDAKSPLSVMTILSSSSELNDNFRNLLKIAGDRIRNSMMDLQSASVEISSFKIGEAIDNVTREFNATSGITFDVVKQDDFEVQGNRHQFERIISNIFLNSIEAGHKKESKLSVEVKRAASLCQVCIQDQGEGVPDSIISRLGKDPVSFGKTEGQGLGLSYAFRTLPNWGGSINIHSTGTGALVTISLLLR